MYTPYNYVYMCGFQWPGLPVHVRPGSEPQTFPACSVSLGLYLPVWAYHPVFSSSSHWGMFLAGCQFACPCIWVYHPCLIASSYLSVCLCLSACSYLPTCWTAHIALKACVYLPMTLSVRWWWRSVAQECLTLCDLTDCSTPGFSVPHHLLKFAQVHVHCISDAIQPSHPSSSALNLCQQQELFQWVSRSPWVTKILEHQLQHQFCQ